MPPWKPEAGVRRASSASGGSTDAQIVTIERWAKHGTPRGEPRRISAAARAGASDGSSASPDLVVDAARLHAARRRHRCLPQLRRRGPRVSTPRYVRGFEFRPGSRAVHHANIRIDPTPASRRSTRPIRRPGYEGAILHSADYPDGHFLGWTPRTGAAARVERSRLAPRRRQRSRRAAARAADRQDRSASGRRSACTFADAAADATRRRIVRLGRQNLDIPAGAAATTASPTRTCCRWTPRSARIQPHAHYRARERQRVGDASGRRAPSADSDPATGTSTGRISTATRRRSGCRPATRSRWSTSSTTRDANPRNPSTRRERVPWGWRSSDEMADVWIR